jgi:hypothetical protein
MIRHEYTELHFRTPQSKRPYVSMKSNQHIKPYFERFLNGCSDSDLKQLDLVSVLEVLAKYGWLPVTTFQQKNKSMMILKRNISKIARVDYVSDAAYIQALEFRVNSEI